MDFESDYAIDLGGRLNISFAKNYCLPVYPAQLDNDTVGLLLIFVFVNFKIVSKIRKFGNSYIYFLYNKKKALDYEIAFFVCRIFYFREHKSTYLLTYNV